MGKDKPLGGKAAAAKEAKDKAAVAAAKEKGVEMCVEPYAAIYRFLVIMCIMFSSALPAFAD